MLDSRWSEMATYTFKRGKLPGYATLIEYKIYNLEYDWKDGVYFEKILSTRIDWRVVAINKEGLSDWPCEYDSGHVVYDHPEWYPKYVKGLAKQAYKARAKLRGELNSD